MKKIDGRKAKVINAGNWYDSYRGFAERLGYPDAVKSRLDRKNIENGNEVILLVSGPHTPKISERTLWIVERISDGERFIIGEAGIEILPNESGDITVLPDESIGGILREYREVKRKANVGERIKRPGTWGSIYKGGGVYVVDSSDDVGITKVGEMIRLYHKNYVVLEPTDKVRIGNERFRMVNRKAAAGERVISLINDIRGGRGGFSAGDIFEVTYATSMRDDDGELFGAVFTDRNGCNFRCFWGGEQYRVLEPLSSVSSPTVPDRVVEDIATLARRVAELEREVAALKVPETSPKITVNVSGKVDAESVSEELARAIRKHTEGPSVPKPLTRDDVIEKAKRDVVELLGRSENHDRSIPSVKECGPLSLIKFEINRKKRTVVALMTWKNIPGDVRKKGFARCAPGDVFNVHIGRTIALRRALGLEVPAEYLTAPKPSEVRVGDIIAWDVDFAHYRVTKPESARGTDKLIGVWCVDGTSNWEAFCPDFDGAVILDDSREEVSE